MTTVASQDIDLGAFDAGTLRAFRAETGCLTGAAK